MISYIAPYKDVLTLLVEAVEYSSGAPIGSATFSPTPEFFWNCLQDKLMIILDAHQNLDTVGALIKMVGAHDKPWRTVISQAHHWEVLQFHLELLLEAGPGS